MGKRKSSKKPVAKKARPKLEKTFNCPFCNAHNAVECRRCTDALRKPLMKIEDINAYTLTHKGYTAFTPGIAIAERVMEELK